MNCRFCGAVVAATDHFCSACGRENLVFLHDQTVPFGFQYDTTARWYYYAEIVEDFLGNPMLRIAYYDATTRTSGTEFQSGTQRASFSESNFVAPTFSPSLDGVAPHTYFYDRQHGWYYRFYVERNPQSHAIFPKVSYFNPVTGIFTKDDGTIALITKKSHYNDEIGFSVYPTKNEQTLKKKNRHLKVWIVVLSILLVLVLLGMAGWVFQEYLPFSFPLGFSASPSSEIVNSVSS